MTKIPLGFPNHQLQRQHLENTNGMIVGNSYTQDISIYDITKTTKLSTINVQHPHNKHHHPTKLPPRPQSSLVHRSSKNNSPIKSKQHIHSKVKSKSTNRSSQSKQNSKKRDNSKSTTPHSEPIITTKNTNTKQTSTRYQMYKLKTNKNKSMFQKNSNNKQSKSKIIKGSAAARSLNSIHKMSKHHKNNNINVTNSVLSVHNSSSKHSVQIQINNEFTRPIPVPMPRRHSDPFGGKSMLLTQQQIDHRQKMKRLKRFKQKLNKARISNGY